VVTRLDRSSVQLRFDDEGLEREFLTAYEGSGLGSARATLVLLVALFVGYAFYDAAVSPDRLSTLFAIRLAIVAVLALVLTATWHPRWEAWQIVLLPAAGVVCGWGLLALGAVAPPDQDLLFAGGIAITVVGTLTLFRLRFRVLIGVSAVIGASYLAWAVSGGVVPEARVAATFLVPTALLLGALGGWNIERYARREFLAERAAERLLRNVLPDAIAERLKDEPGPIAEDFAAATVLFADIVDFSGLSARMGPDALVRFLNEVFTSFDRIVERRGVEKIKTIGDAYMAVAGLPVPCPDHVDRALATAGEMLVEAERRAGGPEGGFRVRVGVATGPVVAGVIGESKFAYDLWGDPVTLASRMESHGVPGRIHVTGAVVRAADGSGWTFEPRGEIEVKGHGPMETWLVTPPPVAPPPPSGFASGDVPA